MPADGFIEGILGGLAGGTADAMWEAHQQQVQQDLEDRRVQLDFIKEAMASPNFRPEFLPIAFQQMQQILNAKPGSKGNKGKREGAMGGFIGKMAPKPSPEQVKAVDPTGRRDRYQQEVQQTGTSPRGFSAIPGIDPMFNTPLEAASEKFQQQKPGFEFQLEKQRLNQEAIMQRQMEVQNQMANRQKMHDERIAEAKASQSVNATAAALKAANPELTDVDAQKQAGEMVLQVQKDKHQDMEMRWRNVESQVATRKANVTNATRLADSMISHRKFIEQVTPLKLAIATADRDVSAAESRVRSLMLRRATLLQAATAATDEKIKASVAEQVKQLDAEIESAYQAHQNAVDSIQNNANQIDQLSGRQMTPVPSSKPKSKAASDPMGIR
jgi:hypothetical protein